MISTVKQSIQLSENTHQVFLKTNASINYTAGQYINVVIEGFDSLPFSIANAPNDDSIIELHLRFLPIPFSQKLLAHIQLKKPIEIDGPFGKCIYEVDCDHPIIFMAGGVGLAPAKAIIEEAIRQNNQRPMHLYWGARTEDDLYLNELFEELAQKNPQFTYTPVLSEPEGDTHWQGRIGLVHDAIAIDHPNLSKYQVYASGPPEMVFTGREVFLGQGLDSRYFYSDLVS